MALFLPFFLWFVLCNYNFSYAQTLAKHRRLEQKKNTTNETEKEKSFQRQQAETWSEWIFRFTFFFVLAVLSLLFLFLWLLICPPRFNHRMTFSSFSFFFVSVIFKLNYFLPTFITHQERERGREIEREIRFLSTYCASISGWKPWQRSCSPPNVSVQKSCFINFGINELSMVKKLVRLWTGNFASRKHSCDSKTILARSAAYMCD